MPEEKLYHIVAPTYRQRAVLKWILKYYTSLKIAAMMSKMEGSELSPELLIALTKMISGHWITYDNLTNGWPIIGLDQIPSGLLPVCATLTLWELTRQG